MPPPSRPAPAPAHTGDADGEPGENHEAIPQLVRKPRDSGGWFIGLVFIPLISYSLLATVAVIVLWYRLQQQPPPPPNPLETLPSFDPSDEQHSTHLPLNNKMQMAIPRNIDVKTATLPLPDNLLVRLGDGRKLRIGDLEVEPLSVRPEKVSVRVQGFDKAEECQYPSLVLRLKLRNVSSDVTFQPMDTYFDRRWKKGEAPPLTLLELDSPNRTTRFFGGPAEFHMVLLHANSGGDPPQWIEGAHRDQVLGPGEEMETFVCTDGDDKNATEAVENYHGRLLWRVPPAPRHRQAGRAPLCAGLVRDRRPIHRRRLPEKQLTGPARKKIAPAELPPCRYLSSRIGSNPYSEDESGIAIRAGPIINEP